MVGWRCVVTQLSARASYDAEQHRLAMAVGAFLWRIFFGAKFLFDTLIRLVGPLFVVVGSSLIAMIAVVHFRTLLSYYHGDLWTLAGVVDTVFSVWMVSNIFFNYFLCIFTAPGTSPDVLLPPEEVERLLKEPAPYRGQGFSRFCKACKRPKPERTHHCHVCRKCVLKMDHHCPWVSNCVGHNNHRYFFLFMAYLWCSAAYVACLGLQPFFNAGDFRAWLALQPHDMGSIEATVTSRTMLIFSVVLCLAICVALGLMVVWHMYLIYSAQTTIEFYVNRWNSLDARQRNVPWRNVYDLGALRNFKDFFGCQQHWWEFALPHFRGSAGNGVSWATKDAGSDIERQVGPTLVQLPTQQQQKQQQQQQQQQQQPPQQQHVRARAANSNAPMSGATEHV